MITRIGVGFVERCVNKKVKARATDNKNEAMRLFDPFTYGLKSFYMQSVLTANGGINMPFGVYMETCVKRFCLFVS